jgi:YfiH family protein
VRVYPFKIEFKENDFFITFPFIFNESPVEGAFCFLSSRLAGDMKYDGDRTSRLSLLEKAGLNSDSVFGLKQVHSRDVLVVDGGHPPAGEADGMVSCDADVALSVTVADCLPVFLFDTKTKAFGIVHSGWKGTGIAAGALKLMNKKWGTKAGNVAAVLGPCIDSCCYKVDEQRYKEFEKEFGGEAVRKSGDGFFLDLKKANVNLLSGAGVKNIAVCENCTFTDERLGSFRREGERFTRMLALVGRSGD